MSASPASVSCEEEWIPPSLAVLLECEDLRRPWNTLSADQRRWLAGLEVVATVQRTTREGRAVVGFEVNVVGPDGDTVEEWLARPGGGDTLSTLAHAVALHVSLEWSCDFARAATQAGLQLNPKELVFGVQPRVAWTSPEVVYAVLSTARSALKDVWVKGRGGIAFYCDLGLLQPDGQQNIVKGLAGLEWSEHGFLCIDGVHEDQRIKPAVLAGWDDRVSPQVAEKTTIQVDRLATQAFAQMVGARPRHADLACTAIGNLLWNKRGVVPGVDDIAIRDALANGFKGRGFEVWLSGKVIEPCHAWRQVLEQDALGAWRRRDRSVPRVQRPVGRTALRGVPGDGTRLAVEQLLGRPDAHGLLRNLATRLVAAPDAPAVSAALLAIRSAPELAALLRAAGDAEGDGDPAAATAIVRELLLHALPWCSPQSADQDSRESAHQDVPADSVQTYALRAHTPVAAEMFMARVDGRPCDLRREAGGAWVGAGVLMTVRARAATLNRGRDLRDKLEQAVGRRRDASSWTRGGGNTSGARAAIPGRAHGYVICLDEPRANDPGWRTLQQAARASGIEGLRLVRLTCESAVDDERALESYLDALL